MIILESQDSDSFSEEQNGSSIEKMGSPIQNPSKPDHFDVKVRAKFGFHDVCVIQDTAMSFRAQQSRF